jgi:hypothetical protein
MMWVNQAQSDIRKMKKFVCERIPPDRTRIVMADGPDGPAWLDLTPLWGDDGDCDLVVESNEPNAFGLRDVYEHFRRKEMTGWEWERELAAEIDRWKVHDLERENDVLREKPDRRPGAEGERVSEYELPKEVSTAEAAHILGVSKDTVLKLKEAGLLEYRNLAPPTSIRGVFRFLLASVLELRNSYQTDFPTPMSLPQPQRRRVRQKEQPKFKHLRLD